MAIQKLQEEGYTSDFNLCNTGVENRHKKKVYPASDLEVVKYYRFEGQSDPAYNTVLYVIETSSGEKGMPMGHIQGTYRKKCSKNSGLGLEMLHPVIAL